MNFLAVAPYSMADELDCGLMWVTIGAIVLYSVLGCFIGIAWYRKQKPYWKYLKRQTEMGCGYYKWYGDEMRKETDL